MQAYEFVKLSTCPRLIPAGYKALTHFCDSMQTDSYALGEWWPTRRFMESRLGKTI